MTTLNPTMKAWLYTGTGGGLEKNMHLNTSARTPPPPKPNEVLVQVLVASLNPADYKVPEMLFGLAAKLVIGTPASPGMDFCGRVLATGSGSAATRFTAGQLVFGCASRPVKFGSLAECLCISADLIAAVPDGVAVEQAAGIGIAGQTALQSLDGYVKAGDKVFVNGGSGGCGLFAIQIAKGLGCHVTATCSTRNVELCRSVGADEVIDYTAEKDLSATLRERGVVFDHILDHIGLPYDLYFQCHHFLKPEGVFLQVGANSMAIHVGRVGWPKFLGGGRRQYTIFFFANKQAHVVAIGDMLQKGTLKVQVDSEYELEDAVKAFEKLRSGRARGKVLVHVCRQ
ncbi:Polyketide synthase enoylreductase [Penicillium verhagenii]|uniref:Polyketide synthase enoylreductase n=1 Tax=Penicillium verhagenii TaxID=1562060 RepID=UPI0025453C50|nr:Polyketide synthase enoylreductase [Penicillium verhagenii]KAJ5928378.1 Polyketide synthase enoylreductase [Penicillium verhagenii]